MLAIEGNRQDLLRLNELLVVLLVTIFKEIITNLMVHATSTIFGIFFINVGIAHFTDTQWFEPIVPDVLGDPTSWVLITGIIEIVLGIGIVVPQTRSYCPLH